MPVEINLLPGRKKKAKTLPMLFLLIGVLALIGLLVIVAVSSSMENERQVAEDELQEARLVTAELESELNELESSEILLLEEMIVELEEKIVPASNVLTAIVSELPPESSLTMYDYQFPDQVTLEGLFTSMPELARYQYALESTAMIQLAEVDVVFGEEIVEEMDEEAFWYEEYLPQYFATIHLTLHPDAARSYDRGEALDGGVEEDTGDIADEPDIITEEEPEGNNDPFGNAPEGNDSNEPAVDQENNEGFSDAPEFNLEDDDLFDEPEDEMNDSFEDLPETEEEPGDNNLNNNGDTDYEENTDAFDFDEEGEDN